MPLPFVEINQFNTYQNPSGYRNAYLSASGWIKTLDTSSSGHLDFGNIDITTSGSMAGTQLIVARLKTLGDATTIEDFRLYINSATAWTTGTVNFKHAEYVHFQSGLTLSQTAQNLPIGVPSQQNILSTHSGTFIQTNAESGCTQYVYLNVFADTDVNIGQKGGPANGGYRYRLRYSFY